MAGNKYNYEREFGDAIHSGPYTFNVDHPGEPQILADRIKTSIPTKSWKVFCDGKNLSIESDQELTIQEIALMESCIDIHKAVDDWPPAV